MKQLIYLILLIFLFQSCTENQPKEATNQANIVEEKIENRISTEPEAIADSLPEPVAVKKPILLIDYDTTQWTELVRLDNSIVMDLRYATENNFMEEQVYDCGRCFLRPKVADAVLKAHQILQKQGLGLKMFDCYRPRPIQWKLWNKVPNPKYVADPRKGSMHNRGAAVDLTIVNKNGEELDMGTEYDYFGKEGWTFYEDLPEEVLKNRKLLRETLGKVNLKHIKTEWWHFAYRQKRYAISDFVWECE